MIFTAPRKPPASMAATVAFIESKATESKPLKTNTWALLSRIFFFQAEDGIRDAQESRGLGDVYKRQNEIYGVAGESSCGKTTLIKVISGNVRNPLRIQSGTCLLYTSDAADDLRV